VVRVVANELRVSSAESGPPLGRLGRR
jgi:hypothetical protein